MMMLYETFYRSFEMIKIYLRDSDLCCRVVKIHYDCNLQ